MYFLRTLPPNAKLNDKNKMKSNKKGRKEKLFKKNSNPAGVGG
jgi:hypothetical protein